MSTGSIRLSTLIWLMVLISLSVTGLLAVASYAAYKVRERRRRKPTPAGETRGVYFERYVPPASGSESADA